MPIIDSIKKIFTQKKSVNSSTVSSVNNSNYKGYEYLRLHDREDGNLTYKQYKNIMKDSQVKVGLEILKYFLISKNYTLTSNSDDESDVMITEFVQDCLDNMETPFRDVIKNILTAIRYGYSVQEKVYTVNSDNRIVWKGLYPIHRKTLEKKPFIKDDKTGELIGIHQEAELGTVDLPIEKCLVYSFDKEFDEVEGNSILNNIKYVVDDKEDTKDWLMTFAEQHENPVKYGKSTDRVSANQLLESLKKVSDGVTQVVIGAEDEIGVLESSRNGDTFFRLIQYFDNQIFRSFFIGNLMLGDTSQTGSYAQIAGQQDFMLYIMNGILTDVAQEIQKSINELVSWNFGESAKAPGFSFESFIDKDILALMNALQPYIGNGALDSDNQGFKELLSKAFLKHADIKLDIDNIEDTNQILEDNTDFGYQEPLPGSSEAEQLVNDALEGII